MSIIVLPTLELNEPVTARHVPFRLPVVYMLRVLLRRAPAAALLFRHVRHEFPHRVLDQPRARVLHEQGS